MIKPISFKDRKGVCKANQYYYTKNYMGQNKNKGIDNTTKGIESQMSKLNDNYT